MCRLPRLALAILLLLAPTGRVPADVLVLKDGTVHVGEVQRRTLASVVFRTRIDGKWTDLALARDEIDQLFEDPGDQAAEAGAAPEAARPKRRSAPAAPPDPSVRPDVAVVPLRGQVGGLVEGSVQGTFDAALVEHFLDRARTDGAKVVVLDIDSPGGYLDEMEQICQAIIDRSADQRIVAYAGDALSAAAVIALTCRELIVRPDSRIGAAVMVRAGGDGLTAVDAKLASPRHARQRQFMEASGRPYPLLAAMTIQERELWWSRDAGFIDDAAVAEQAGDAERVDGATTVLTMLSEDALRWEVASAVAPDAGGLATALGLEDDAVVVDYGDDVREHVADADRRVRRVLEEFGTYFQSLGVAHELLVRLERGAGVGADDVRRQLGQAQRAARSIRRVDRRLLASRTAVPESLLDQLQDDAEALARIATLVRDDTGGGAAAARRGIEQILERWRALMAF